MSNHGGGPTHFLQTTAQNMGDDDDDDDDDDGDGDGDGDDDICTYNIMCRQVQYQTYT